MLEALLVLALAAPLQDGEAPADPGTIAITNFKGLEPSEQQVIVLAIKDRIEASKEPALKALLALRDRAKKELPRKPAKPLEFYEHSVYAPIQAPRSMVDSTSADGEQQYETMRPWESEPPFNAVRIRYDFASDCARDSQEPENPVAQISDYLFGCIPDNDALVAWICWRLDKRKDLDPIADYFGHAYCDRVGNCYSNITMYDAFASQENIERSDIDVIAFARNILKDNSFVSPIPGDNKQQKLYDSIGDAFLGYFRYRTSNEYVAYLFVNPDGAMRKDHEALREYYWTLFAKFDAFDDVVSNWNGFKDREDFKAKINEWRKEPGIVERANAWRAAHNQIRWTVNGIATAVLKERSIWPEGSAESKPAAEAPKPETKDTTEETKMLSVGDTAPNFAVPDETGTVRTLAEFKGKTVLIWFFPKASTSGCTIEGCGFRDRTPDFEKLGVVILGASFDAPEANRAFKENQGFKYSLLCDTDKKLSLAYGAAKDTSAMYADRMSVVIGPDGKILKLYPKVSAKTFFDEALKDLGGTPPTPPAGNGGGFFKRLFGRL